MTNKKTLEEYKSRIGEVENIMGLQQCIKYIIKQYGYTDFGFVDLGKVNVNAVLVSLPKELMRNYCIKDLDEDDVTLKYFEEVCSQPTYQSKIHEKMASLYFTRYPDNYFKKLEDFNLRFGYLDHFMTPVKKDIKRVLSVTKVFKEKGSHKENLRLFHSIVDSNKDDLAVLTDVIYKKFVQIKNKIKLTDKQKAILRAMLSDSWKTKNQHIDAFGVSRSTFNEHLKLAQKKLGVTNDQLAVTVAYEFDIISMYNTMTSNILDKKEVDIKSKIAKTI